MGELREVVAREINGLDRVGYYGAEVVADDVITALREHLSAHPEALAELRPTSKPCMKHFQGASCQRVDEHSVHRDRYGNEWRAPALPAQKDGE